MFSSAASAHLSLSRESNPSQNKKKRVKLFCDVNGTIMAADTSRDKDRDAAILQLLAENYSSKWDSKSEEMTFRKYLEKYLCPGNSKDLEIKKSRLEGYKNFIEFLKTNNHPLQNEIESRFEAIKESLSKGKVFTSFIDLIHYLNKGDVEYTIIFRTFGNDLNDVIKEVAEKANLKFEACSSFKEGSLHLANGQILNTPAEMLNSIQPFAHSGWQDHWKHWNANGETHESGKPYPINLDDENVVSIFFDDNALDKEIIGVKHLSEIHYEQKELQKELIRLGRIVPVNTLQAILDPNYFIDKVKFALNTKLQLLIAQQQPHLTQSASSSSVNTYSSVTSATPVAYFENQARGTKLESKDVSSQTDLKSTDLMTRDECQALEKTEGSHRYRPY